jgi:hypothetical protein
MKSSLHSLISFLPFLIDYLRLPSQETLSILFCRSWILVIEHRGGSNRKHLFYRYSPIIPRLLLMYSFPRGTCLQSRCLGMNVYSGSAIPAFRSHVTALLTVTYCKVRSLCGIWWPNICRLDCFLFVSFLLSLVLSVHDVR